MANGEKCSQRCRRGLPGMALCGRSAWPGCSREHNAKPGTSRCRGSSACPVTDVESVETAAHRSHESRLEACSTTSQMVRCGAGIPACPSDTYRSKKRRHEVRHHSSHASPTLKCDGFASLCDGWSWRSLRCNSATVRCCDVAMESVSICVICGLSAMERCSHPASSIDVTPPV